MAGDQVGDLGRVTGGDGHVKAEGNQMLGDGAAKAGLAPGDEPGLGHNELLGWD